MMITNDWLLHENDYALAHLETYYQDILTRLQRDYPESFFFQAEDGIRAYKVTGVQTCALPILQRAGGLGRVVHHMEHQLVSGIEAALHQHKGRSEERRVGKEGRSRWSRNH